MEPSIRPATADELTYIVNHPRIAPKMGIGDDEVVDMSDFYERKGNVAFTSPLGAMCFAYVGDGEYECHFLFVSGHSAKEIKQHARDMHEEMFTKHGACVIKGYPPRENRAVRVIGTALGYRKIPDAEYIDDLGRVCDTYEMRREQWEI